jgi:hypothetical protein
MQYRAKMPFSLGLQVCPCSQVWVVFSLAMTGKFLIAAAFAIAYLFTAELFPTPVRYPNTVCRQLFVCSAISWKNAAENFGH